MFSQTRETSRTVPLTTSIWRLAGVTCVLVLASGAGLGGYIAGYREGWRQAIELNGRLYAEFVEWSEVRQQHELETPQRDDLHQGAPHANPNA